MMNHDIRLGRLRKSGTAPPMHLPLQHQLKRQLPNMHGQHPAAAIGPLTIFSKVVGLLLDDHAHTGTTPPPWPTETAFVVAVGHHDVVVQAFTLEQIHQGKGLRADGV